MVADMESYRALWRAAYPNGKRTRSTETVRVKQIDGRPIMLRGGAADARVALDTFIGKYHLPETYVTEPRTIWDLGSNVGYTMAHMAHLYPFAHVTGVELDVDNVEFARSNIAPWAHRCDLIWAAAWYEDGEISYSAEPGREAGHRLSATGRRRAPALSLNSLLKRTGAPDYVKMDIEGAEEYVLRESTDWSASVGVISVECHPPYTLQRCRHDLQSLGFQVHDVSRFRRARDCAIGVRISSR